MPEEKTQIEELMAVSDENGCILKNHGFKPIAFTVEGAGKIIIFASRIDDVRTLEATYLHEELHHISNLSPIVHKALQSLGKTIEARWPRYGEKVRLLYENCDDDLQTEEIATNGIDLMIRSGEMEVLYEMLDEIEKRTLTFVLNTIGYESAEEIEGRIRTRVSTSPLRVDLRTVSGRSGYAKAGNGIEEKTEGARAEGAGGADGVAEHKGRYNAKGHPSLFEAPCPLNGERPPYPLISAAEPPSTVGCRNRKHGPRTALISKLPQQTEGSEEAAPYPRRRERKPAQKRRAR